MRLCLESDSDVLDGAREDGVGEAGEGACAVVLRVGEGGGIGGVGGLVGGFELAARPVEGAELDGDLDRIQFGRGKDTGGET